MEGASTLPLPTAWAGPVYQPRTQTGEAIRLRKWAPIFSKGLKQDHKTSFTEDWQPHLDTSCAQFKFEKQQQHLDPGAAGGKNHCENHCAHSMDDSH